MDYIKAKAVSYDSKHKRDKSDIKYIVIHYTGNKGDTARNNANYFANWNTRNAGAHFFVDQNGDYVKSIALNRTAWAVGGNLYADCARTGGGKYYGKCTNYNSVSIELCDLVDKEPSDKMVKGVKEVIAYIREYCPNAKAVITHFMVTGKSCPLTMVKQSAWEKFLQRIGEANVISTAISPYLVKVTSDTLNVRTEPNANAAKTATLKKGGVYTVTDERGGWGKLKSGAGWINLAYTEQV